MSPVSSSNLAVSYLTSEFLSVETSLVSHLSFPSGISVSVSLYLLALSLPRFLPFLPVGHLSLLVLAPSPLSLFHLPASFRAPVSGFSLLSPVAATRKTPLTQAGLTLWRHWEVFV